MEYIDRRVKYERWCLQRVLCKSRRGAFSLTLEKKTHTPQTIGEAAAVRPNKKVTLSSRRRSVAAACAFPLVPSPSLQRSVSAERFVCLHSADDDGDVSFPSLSLILSRPASYGELCVCVQTTTNNNPHSRVNSSLGRVDEIRRKK